MNWTSTKPNSPGVWWYCDGVSEEVQRWGVYGDGDDLIAGQVNNEGRIYDSRLVAFVPDGFWCKQDAPPAHIAPKPPAMQMWLAEINSSKAIRYIVRVGDRFTALNENCQFCGSGFWNGIGQTYTLIRKV
jgi:hypothetical protein